MSHEEGVKPRPPMQSGPPRPGSLRPPQIPRPMRPPPRAVAPRPIRPTTSELRKPAPEKVNDENKTDDISRTPPLDNPFSSPIGVANLAAKKPVGPSRPPGSAKYASLY